MPVQVLVAVTTHNSMMSTQFVRGCTRRIHRISHRDLTTLAGKNISIFFWRQIHSTWTHLSHPTDPPRDALQPSSEGGVLRPCVATRFLGWGCVGHGCVPASDDPPYLNRYSCMFSNTSSSKYVLLQRYSAHEQDLPPRVKRAIPTNEILSRIRTFGLGPFWVKHSWEVFFPIQFASSWRFQPAATGEFFVELRSIKVPPSRLLLCMGWLRLVGCLKI